MMIGFGIGAENFSILGALFVATLLESSDSQKKVNSGSSFRCGDVRDVVTFDGEATSFMSSASGFQKNENSQTGFGCKITGDSMIRVTAGADN